MSTATHLEVQVVIDDNDNCFVSSGFMQQPTGMKLPIKCWIHTHPLVKHTLAELIGILSIFGRQR